jgi:hypothetical protein
MLTITLCNSSEGGEHDGKWICCACITARFVQFYIWTTPWSGSGFWTVRSGVLRTTETSFDSALAREINFRRMCDICNGGGDGHDEFFHSRGFEKGSARKKT